MQNQGTLSERELLNDALYSENKLINAYGTYLAEATCQNLRNEIDKIIAETQQVQFEIYDAMKQRGWYQTKNAQLQDVQQATQKYQQIKTEIS